MSGFKTKKLSHTLVQKPLIEIEKEEVLPKKSKKSLIRWIIGFLIFISSGVFATVFITNINRDNSKNGSEHFVPILGGDSISVKKEGTVNILIAGIGGQGHDGSDLTDSIMLASLNGEAKRITLLSIPRDLYVSYGEGKGAGRINGLYGIGKANGVGVKYLADKVAEITGQQIDHYAVIDFSGFKKIIDVIGGIQIDVPDDLIDKEYPDDNWGYETLMIRKGLQLMDGTTALKYARSRHSTSDFDRSNRQQLIIKAIKNKLFSTDTTTNPAKISEIFSTVMDHLDTDMSLATMAETIFSYRSISENAIKIHTLNNECLSLKQCMTGAYLYSPSRDLFGNASVVIPENARVNKLSYYTDIRRFVDITFRFPEVSSASDDIILVTTKAHLRKAQEIALNLSKLGIKISTRHPIIVSTGTILQSHVNIYWHPDLAIGISPDSVSVEALRYLEESLPYNIVPHNEYVTTDGPKIEIVLGDDIESYFPFITAIYYIPNPTPEIRTVSGNTVSGENRNTSGATQSQRKNNIPIKSTTGTDQSKVKNQSPQTSGKNIQPGEWEDFGG